jgi:3-hydroxypropanoate dehydrogenase
MKDNFAGPGKEAAAAAAAFRNGSLQGAYLMVAARLLGLDVGAMSGFDAAKVDAEFWAGTKIKTNFICNLGHGDPAKVMSRLPRFQFDEISKIL